jgi:tetratricopeptide (TPR) repeat protein
MDWQSFLELSNDSLDDLRSVGYLYIKQGCFDIALDFFNALLILTPGNFYDTHTLGSLYLQKGKYQEALNYLDKAIEIDPNNLLVKLNKARALFSLGYRTEGIEQARVVSNSKNAKLANQATALINAYS